jgi:microcystin-dependent protein
MSEPFMGEIRCVGFNFVPRGWARCQGQTLSIQQNAALYSLLGTTYGGNGVSTFNLPNLDGRIPRGLQISNRNSTPVENDQIMFGGILSHRIPSLTIHATTIHIVLDNP